MGGAPDLSK